MDNFVKLDPQVLCPYVYLDDNFVVLKTTYVLQAIHVIIDFTNSESQTFWINWWVDRGPFKYLFWHFDTILKNAT